MLSTGVCFGCEWNVLQLIDCSALHSIPITGISPLLWLPLTSHSSLLLRLMRPPVRPPRLRRWLFSLIYPPHLLVLPATFGLHLILQTYPYFRALYAVPVRRTKGLPTASFRFHLTMDTLAVQLCASLLPRRTHSGLSPVRARPWRANKNSRDSFLLLFAQCKASFKVHLIRLAPEKQYVNTWSITICCYSDKLTIDSNIPPMLNYR